MRFTIVKRFTAALIALFLTACSTNIDEAFEKTDEFSVQVYHSGQQVSEYKIKRGTEKYLKFEKWASDNNWGWSPTPADYAPGIVVSGEGHVFNFNGETVVVNKPDGQYAKNISSGEYEFLTKDTLE